MPFTGWSDEEIIILVYYTSRGFKPSIVAEILSRRQFSRSLESIETMILEIVNDNPTLQVEPGLWDNQSVDQWIDALSLDHQTVSRLIQFTEADANMVEEV
ncbi:hypothetical protein N7474_010120 [Penicillium riverlandense]|uniref:uncharacterized protein n=1 Tax=Penicillium riverlandense TaxID=1903569 RepID=UPI0025494744|nr:uncharacterized protein N7474_010120 [Penicillium riverlandense]KAJ5808851.1 hypothetical protein N7474_010120 [Penicillium riverlandense]